MSWSKMHTVLYSLLLGVIAVIASLPENYKDAVEEKIEKMISLREDGRKRKIIIKIKFIPLPHQSTNYYQ